MENELINKVFIVTQCDASLNGTENSLQDCMINNVSSCPCFRIARLVCEPGMPLNTLYRH